MNMHCLLLSATFSLLFLSQRKSKDKQPIKEKIFDGEGDGEREGEGEGEVEVERKEEMAKEKSS